MAREKTKEELVGELARAWNEMPTMGGCLSSINVDMTLEQAIAVNLKNMQRMNENVTCLCLRRELAEKENQELRGQRDAIRSFLGCLDKGKH